MTESSPPPPLEGGASVERRFLGWHRPALDEAAAVLLEDAPVAPGGGPDLSGTLVVVPGGRAGRLLLERLVARAEDAGTALRPPAIVSAGQLPERLYVPELPAPDAVMEALVWTRAVRDTDPAELRRILPELPPATDEAGWEALGALLRDLYREIGGEGFHFGTVRSACGGEFGFDDRARWTVLEGIQLRALAAFRGLGRMDREEARRRVLARARPGGVAAGDAGEGAPAVAGAPVTGVAVGGAADGLDRPALQLVLVGTAELPGVTRRFLGRLPATTRIRSLVHAPDGRADDFDALGCVIPERWEGERLSIPEAWIEVVDRPGDQADAVLRGVARLGPGRSAEEITVGVPDPQVVPFVADRFREAGIPTRDAAGRPLDRTPLFRLLEATGRYLRSRTFEDFAALLRHPWVEDWFDRQDPTLAARVPAVLDRFHHRHLPSVLPRRGPLPAGGERKSDGWARGVDALRLRLDGLLDPLAADPGAPRSAWPERVRAYLLEVLGDRSLRRSGAVDRELLEAVAALERTFAPIEALPDALDRPVGGGEFLRFLLTQLRGGAIAPPSESGAVELLGWLELHLDDAPILFLCGVNEPHLPEAVTADPFLPNRLRTRVGLPDNRRRWARDLYRLRAILSSRERVGIVAGRRGDEGDPLRLSRLLLAERPETVARRIRVALGRSERPEEEESALPAHRSDDAPRTDPVRLPPEPVLRDPSARTSLSVTGFRNFLRDPYAFGLSEFRGLEGEDDEAREIDPLGFGTLAHEVLERWGSTEGADRAEGPAIEATFDRLLDASARDWFGSRPLPAVRIQVEQLRARLHAVARAQGVRNAEGWRIRAIEARPPGGAADFPVDGKPFGLRGRIDRIDHHPATGRWALLDYKTTAKPSTPDAAHRTGRGENRRWVDLQLPLYRHLARALRTEEGTPLLPEEAFDGLVDLGYFLVPADLDRTGVEIADAWDAAVLAEADETARDVIRRLREGVVRWEPEASGIRAGDPLAAVVGLGTLRLGSGGDR